MTAPDHRPSTSEAAWIALLDTLREATEIIAGPKGATDALQRAEGFRYLTRVLAGGLDQHLESADPSRPGIVRMLSPTRKFLGDNPDTDYDYVTLDGRYHYVLRGQRTNVTYIGFCIYGEDEEGAATVVGNVSDATLRFEPDGRFELHLAAEEPVGAKNWLALDASTRFMIVREYYLDRSKETRAEYTIEVVNPPPPPGPLTEEDLAARLAAVGAFVKKTAELSAALSIFGSANAVEEDPSVTTGRQNVQVVGGELRAKRRAHYEELAGTVDADIINGHLPTPDIEYTGAFWDLEDDEAVLIEGPSPRARYWSAQIFNRWLESPDYRYLPVAINSRAVKLRPDGTVRMVIAHRDPGVPNWLSTAGHREGTIAVRALLAEDSLDFTFRLVKLDSLPSD